MDVLVIEDDRRIAGLIERGLSENGHHVTVARDGREGVDRLLAQHFDAALLDMLLPGLDGLDVLEQVRAKRCRTAIMMLTAVDAVPSILRAFDLGADDYLVKPFLLEILLARLAAIARRGRREEPEICSAGDLTLDRRRRAVSYRQRPIHLTRKQFDLLEMLVRRAGLVTSREDLLEAGWGNLDGAKDSTLDVYMHGLRAKLAGSAEQDAPVIRTIHGTGYMLVCGGRG